MYRKVRADELKVGDIVQGYDRREKVTGVRKDDGELKIVYKELDQDKFREIPYFGFEDVILVEEDEEKAIINHIRSAYKQHRQNNGGTRPEYLYISFEKYTTAKNSEYFRDHCIEPDGTIKIFGMEVVTVNKQNFIRVGN